MERVSIKQGVNPIIIVAPHGFKGDDENTDLLADLISSHADCYAVINRGWERADDVDIFQDKADCNNIQHCLENVVKDEFLDPIIRFKNKIRRQTNEPCYIFYIHGMADKHRKLADDLDLDIVLGYGAGRPNSYTCEIWQKDFMLNSLDEAGFGVREGRKGGSMSGWARNNLNQYFRKWDYDTGVCSMQLEIIYEMRKNQEFVELVAEEISKSILNLRKIIGFQSKKKFDCY